MNLTLHVHERQMVDVNVSDFVRKSLAKYSFSKDKTIGGRGKENRFVGNVHPTLLSNNTIKNYAITPLQYTKNELQKQAYTNSGRAAGVGFLLEHRDCNHEN